MKREEKNALSRQRILDAAMEEFAQKGYDGASLNAVCAEKGISKGMIYHYFKDKDELYLLCVRTCFQSLTDHLRRATERMEGTPEEKLTSYFDARLRYFAAHPTELGLFTSATLAPPAHLDTQITQCRQEFDALNLAVLTELLSARPLRKGLSVSRIVEDFQMYLDFFHLRFRSVHRSGQSPAESLGEYEERCHQQLDILLHGVYGEAQ